METVRIQNGDTEKIVAAFFDNSTPPNPITGETIPMSIWRESNGQWYTGAGWQAGYTTFNISEKGQGIYYYDFDTSGLSDDVYHMRATCSNSSCVNPVQEGELKVGDYVDDLDVAVSTRSSHSASDIWSVGSRTLTSFGTLIADIWSYSTRTITAFSTSLALSVWNVLESAIVTGSSIGLKVKNNLDAMISSRSSHGDPDPLGYIDAAISSGASQASLDALQADINRLLGLTNENNYIDQTSFDGDGNLTSARIRTYSNPASVGTANDVIATYTITAVGSGQGKFSSWKQVKQ